MHALFAYGTLMHPPVIRQVIHRSPQAQAAQLAGYARYRFKGLWYPGIREAPTGRVDGLLFTHITIDELAALDRYESDQYERRTVQLDDARTAEAYIVRPEHYAELMDVDWELDAYLEGAYGPARLS